MDSDARRAAENAAAETKKRQFDRTENLSETKKKDERVC